MQYSSNMYCIVNENLAIVEVSEKLAHFTCYKNSAELIDKHIVSIIPRYYLFIQKNKPVPEDEQILLFASCENSLLPAKATFSKNGTFIKIEAKPIQDKQLIEFVLKENATVNQIVNNVSFGILVLNLDYYVLSVNKKLLSFIGYENEHEVIGKSLIEILSNDAFKQLQVILSRVVDKKFSTDYVFINTDQSRVLKCECLLHQSRLGNYFTVVLVDETESYKAQQELKHRTELFEKVFEYSPVGMFVFSENFIVEQANEAFVNLLSVNREQLIQFDLTTLKDKRPYYLFKNAIINKTVSEYEGHYVSTVSGKEIYVKAISLPVTIGGKHKGIGITLDLTKQKQYEKEILEKQIFYKTMVEMSVAGIGITDLNENLIFVNKAFANMLGYEVEEILHEKDYMFRSQD